MSAASQQANARRSDNKQAGAPRPKTIEDLIKEQMRVAEQKKRQAPRNKTVPEAPKSFELIRPEGWKRLEATEGESAEESVLIARIKKNGSSRRLHVCRQEVLNALGSLIREFPNFREITNEIIGTYRIAMLGARPLSLPVINLQGPPGIGKTTYVRAVAAALGQPFHDLKISQMMDKFEVAGMSRGWRDARPGKIAQILLDEEPHHGQPVILFDELCMASDNEHRSVAHPLYTLFDRDSGEYFRDLFFDIPMNTRHVLIFCATNNVEALRPALRSRLSSFDIEAPSKQEMRSLAQNIYRQLLERFNMTEHFPALLGQKVLAKVTGGSIRDLKLSLERSIIRAVAESPENTQFKLSSQHVPDLCSHKHPIGF